jgi:hypothetical protein
LNVDDINQRVWDRLGEDASNPGRYTEAIIRELLGECVEMWSIAVGGRVGTETITLLDDTLEYALTSEPVRILSVERDGSDFDKALTPITEHELYETQGRGTERRWRDVRSDRPNFYCWHNPQAIWIWPPMSDAGSETLTMTYQEFVQDSLNSGLETPVLVSGGTGYTATDVLTVVGGVGTAATVVVTAVTGGVVSSFAMATNGSYTTNPGTGTLATTGGTGTGATFTFTVLNDVPAVPAEYHRNIVDYIHGRCLMLGTSDADRIERARTLVTRWFQALNTARKRQYETIGRVHQISNTGILK